MNDTHSIDRFDNDELLALAQLSLERKDLEGALLKLKIIVARPNPLPAAIAAIARVYAQLHLFEKAEQFFQDFLQTNPQALLEQFELGMTQFDAGKLAPALQAWDALLQNHPGYPPAMFYKALLLARTGKAGDAKQTLEQLLKGIAVDNLYFERAKKLLQAIESGNADRPRTLGTQSSDETEGDAHFAPPNPYRTEH